MQADISKLSATDLAQLKADIWLLSPSCQPYTVLNPLAKGAEDPRAKSFIHLVEDVLFELTKMGQEPRYMLIENVAGFEVSRATSVFCASLKRTSSDIQHEAACAPHARLARLQHDGVPSDSSSIWHTKF